MSSICAASYPSRSSARGTVRFTNCIVPPPTSFFVFTSASSGSMPVVSQSIISPIVPGRREDGGLRVPIPVPLTERDGLVPRVLRGREEPFGHELALDLVGGLAVLAHHAQHRVRVGVVTLERTHRLGHARGRPVRVPGHQRGDRAGPGAARRRSRTPDRAPSAAPRGWRTRARAAGTPCAFSEIFSVG